MTASRRSSRATFPPSCAATCATSPASFLARNQLDFDDIDRFICHPGGAKVLSALEEAFQLGQGALADGRSVLRDYGNMSASTVLFVLERALRTGIPGRSLMSTLGPGFTAGFLLLEAA